MGSFGLRYTQGVGGRADFDVLVIVAEVIAPALAAVFKPGEIDSVHVAWEELIRMPDVLERAPTQLNVHLVCHGEEHTSNVWTVGDQPYDRDALREHLVTEFSDFVAESQFAWGQQR